ncbi:MAG: 30S ribosomal protein S2 [Kordiimonadaceae bacterium]|nr:30S ribosomal protein S2 [Kordiimonadaceae bacterium]MBT6135137.1 30S ribosomal protein S2 [Kordiimonadaceae bacterium]MBT6467074.1 30S ribosomal protein S2 [Kordiimonadaceae bacterium]MBT7605843.1 30S ribosomal protein S2 [Kordiimonadaceae bacterium]
MAMPTFTMRDLLEAGVHFGHQKHRWNPRMEDYIFGVKNKVHIINLSITVPLLHRALEQVRDVTAAGGRVLFVGTKRQASGPIAEAAKRCGQYYVNHRWLGGMLTNWETISKSIKRLNILDEKLANDVSGLTKKETLQMTRERDKLERSLGGIKEMGGIPSAIFVVDTNKEELAIAEGKKLGIPVIAVLDTNCDPENIDFPIPGNDDATRAIDLYCNLVADAVLDGIQQELSSAGVDIGAMEPKVEEIPGAEEVAVEIISEKVEEVAVEVVSAKVKVKKQPPVKPVAEKEKAEEKP